MPHAERIRVIVDSLMHRPVVAADAAMTVRDAARQMERERVGCLIVLRGGKPVGIVTERDLVWRVLGAARDPGAIRLADVMSTPIATVAQDATVESAAELMKKLRVKRLLILRDGIPLGVISVTDIAYASPEASRMLDAAMRRSWDD